MKDCGKIASLITFLLCGSVLCLAQNGAAQYQGKVVSVADGNTLTLVVDNKKLNVRLLGIDVPNQALRDASRENLSRLVSGKSVTFLRVPLELIAGKQRFLVGKVLLNDMDVALSQVTDGFAWQTEEYKKYQNLKDQQAYAAAEQQAKESKRGTWSDSFKACKGESVKTSGGTSAKSNSENAERPKVSGSVIVEVTVDESGNVISARALCGHPVLQTVAVKAASQAKFAQQPTRFTGNIVYNFVQE